MTYLRTCSKWSRKIGIRTQGHRLYRLPEGFFVLFLLFLFFKSSPILLTYLTFWILSNELKHELFSTLMLNNDGTWSENKYWSWGIVNNCHQIMKEPCHLPVHIVLTLFQNNIVMFFLYSFWMGRLCFLISFPYHRFQRYYHWMNKNPQLFYLVLGFQSH